MKEDDDDDGNDNSNENMSLRTQLIFKVLKITGRSTGQLI